MSARDAAADQAEFEAPLAVRRRTWSENVALFARAGWRPAFGWTAVAVLMVGAVIAPGVQLVRGQAVTTPWVQLAVFLGAVSVLFLPRSAEKIMGASA